MAPFYISISCPFCKNTLTSIDPGSSVLLFPIRCENHKDIMVHFIYNKPEKKIDYFSMYNFVDPNLCQYQIFVEKENIFIHSYFKVISVLPPDPNLIPETYNQKLKTYLLFL